MWDVIGGLIGHVASGVLAPVLGYFTSKDAQNLAGFTAAVASDKEVAIAQMQANVQIEQTKATVNSWFGARLITFSFGALMLMHVGAVAFDSIPWWGTHIVGSWQIAALPGPIASWEGTIIESFFALPVLGPPIQAVTAWLHRK